MSNPAQKAAERICGGIVAATPDRIAAIIRTAYAPLLRQAEEELSEHCCKTCGCESSPDAHGEALAKLREALGEQP